MNAASHIHQIVKADHSFHGFFAQNCLEPLSRPIRVVLLINPLSNEPTCHAPYPYSSKVLLEKDFRIPYERRRIGCMHRLAKFHLLDRLPDNVPDTCTVPTSSLFWVPGSILNTVVISISHPNLWSRVGCCHRTLFISRVQFHSL